MPAELLAGPLPRTAAHPPLGIVHVVAPAPFGGLERVVHALAAGQARSGHRVRVLATVGAEPHPFVEGLREAGVEAIPLAVGGRAYLEERRQVLRHCAAAGAEILHTHGYRPDVVSSGVARALRIPRVTTVHGFCGGGWKNRLYEGLQRRSYRRFDAVVSVSRRLSADLASAGVPAELIHTIPNGWSEEPRPLGRAAARAALGLPAEGLVAGWVGRVSREKGADVLADALPLLADLPLRFSFVGDGPERGALRARTEGSAAHWHGALPHASRLFAAFDLFVLSSRTEGTPIALFEAMAAGVPVVATSVGGVPDVVTPREAMLVSPGDPAALAAAIRESILRPEAAAARAAAARLRLRSEFGSQPWLDRYDALYRSARALTR